MRLYRRYQSSAQWCPPSQPQLQFLVDYILICKSGELSLFVTLAQSRYQNMRGSSSVTPRIDINNHSIFINHELFSLFNIFNMG